MILVILLCDGYHYVLKLTGQDAWKATILSWKGLFIYFLKFICVCKVELGKLFFIEVWCKVTLNLDQFMYMYV